MTDTISVGAGGWKYHTIGLSVDQQRVLREMTDRLDISLPDIFDKCMTAYMAQHFPTMTWPHARRQRTWHIHETRAMMPRRNISVFQVAFTHQQEVVFRAILGRLEREGNAPHGLVSAVIEDALVYGFDDLYSRYFPRHTRRRRIVRRDPYPQSSV